MTDAGQPLLQVEDLKKTFYTHEVETHALSVVHLSIRKGEYVAMSGPWAVANQRFSRFSVCSILRQQENIS